MKKTLLMISALMLVSTIFAFHSGQVLAGGNIGFQSAKEDSKSDSYKQVEISPEISYFVHDLFVIDGTIGYAYAGDESQTANVLLIGAGVSFIYSQAYVGMGLQHAIANSSFDTDTFLGTIKSKVSANYLDFKIGYLVPILERTFLDLRADYKMGVGSYGRDGSGSNNESVLSFKAGLKIAFR